MILLLKIKRSPDESHTQIQTNGNLYIFGNHRCLSWSESKYMWTCDNDSAMWEFWNSDVAPSLPHVQYIYSPLIEKGICDCQNILSFHVFVCDIRAEIFLFFGKSFPFLFLFIIYGIMFSGLPFYLPFNLIFFSDSKYLFMCNKYEITSIILCIFMVKHNLLNMWSALSLKNGKDGLYTPVPVHIILKYCHTNLCFLTFVMSTY